MGVEINIVVTKFFNQFKNNTGFGSNLGDYTNNLTGSVMENVKLTQLIDISWTAVATASDEWTVSSTQIIRTSGSFLVDGFAVGDTASFIAGWTTNPLGTPQVTLTITAISTNGKTITFTINTGTFAQPTYNDAGLRGTTPLTSLIYKFGLIEINENFNAISKVSQNEQGYYNSAPIGADLGGGVRDTSFIPMQKLGSYSDWVTGSMRVAFASNPNLYVQRFQIDHLFTVVPYYIAGELSNLENNILPSLFDGTNTLKYAYQPEFRTVISNPNTSKSIILDDNLGSVAWFNENFNGFNNNYEIVSVDYEEQATAATADGLLISGKTKTTIVVQKNNGNFAANERIGAYISYLPIESEYTDTILTDLKENFIYDNVIGNASSGGYASDFITDMTIAVPITNTVEIVIESEYSVPQQLILSGANQPKYVIGIQLGDNTVISASQDRVILIADVTDYDTSPDIPDLMTVDKFEILTHEKDIGVDVGTTDCELWNEDGILIDYAFSLNLNKEAVLNTFKFVVLAYNSITGNYFQLDSYDIPIAGALIQNNPLPAQQFVVATDRGYKLVSGSQFNDVELLTDAQALGFQAYLGKIGQKVPWQEWILNNLVDTIFYDTTEPNDNLNFKSSNYSELNNYSIVLGLLANISGVSDLGVAGLTNYLFLSPNIVIYDYDLDGNITAIWSGVIETFNNATATSIGTAVLSGQDTLMVITWTNSGGAVGALGNLWAIHRIEESNQAGYNIDELSTIRGYPSGNRLKPTGVLTQLDMYLDSGNVVTECLIDGSLITPGTAYNLSGRIGNPDAVSPNPDGKVTSPAGTVEKASSGTNSYIKAFSS